MEDAVLRVIGVLLLIGACANTVVPVPAPAPVTTLPPSVSIEILSDCPFADLKRLNCDEAVARTDELQAHIDRVRTHARVVEVVTVDIMSEPLLGLHMLPVRDGNERVLLVTEDFLVRRNIVEEVEQMVCLIGLRFERSSLPADVRIQRCQYRVAALSRELERARWLWRTTPPEFRPRLLPGTGPPRFPSCPRDGCSIAHDFVG